MQKQENPLLSIIIVNYNVKEELLNCIQSIKDTIDSDDHTVSYEVIISDNGSVDGSVKAVQERFPWVIIVKNNDNLGFGKANNIGAKQSKGRILCFLNPDTLVKDGIKNMIQYLLTNPEVGLVSPLVYEADGKTIAYLYKPVYFHFMLQLLDLFFTPIVRTLYTYKRYNQKKNILKKKPFEAELIHGCIMLLRKEVFNQIGGFDDNIFMYGEETDMWFKLKKLKYKIMIYPNASILHLGSKAVGKIPKIFTETRGAQALKYLFKKYFPFTWYIRYFIELLSQGRQILSAYTTAGLYFILKKNYTQCLFNAKKHTIKFNTFYKVLTNKTLTG